MYSHFPVSTSRETRRSNQGAIEKTPLLPLMPALRLLTAFT
jgi:hypothetical protein